MYLSLSLSLSLYLSLSLSFLVRSCLLITLIKFLKGHKSLGSLCCCVFQKVPQSVSEWVSDKVTYWAVGWTAKKIHIVFQLVQYKICGIVAIEVMGVWWVHKLVLIWNYKGLRIFSLWKTVQVNAWAGGLATLAQKKSECWEEAGQDVPPEIILVFKFLTKHSS